MSVSKFFLHSKLPIGYSKVHLFFQCTQYFMTPHQILFCPLVTRDKSFRIKVRGCNSTQRALRNS